MSSEEMNKKEKGKEIATKKMILSGEEIEVLLQRNMENYKRESSSSSSKITPRIFYTSDEKARLRWSSDLHNCFLNAVEKLGGPKKATPKKVKEKMEIEGLAVHHVKSHLQKFRLGKCNIQDGKNQYLRCFKNARDIKRCAFLNSSRPQANIKPRGSGTVKSKPRKGKEVEGPLYTMIKNDVRERKCREGQRLQKASAIETQSNMFETESFRASTTPSLQSQHDNYDSSSQEQEQPLIALSYNNVEAETNPITMNYTLQGPPIHPIIAPQNMTSIADLCNDGMSCLSLSEPPIHLSQGNLQFSHNMAQGFINPYMTIGSQSVQPGLATITTQQQLQINDVFHDSNGNTTFYSATVPLPFDSFHQGTLSNTSLFSTTPESVPAYCPQHGYMSSYPPYNTLEMVRAQLSALQNSSTNQTQETLSREANVSPSVTVEEEDPVEKYIDWGRVEEKDIFFDPDPTEVLDALGFGVTSP